MADTDPIVPHIIVEGDIGCASCGATAGEVCDLTCGCLACRERDDVPTLQEAS